MRRLRDGREDDDGQRVRGDAVEAADVIDEEDPKDAEGQGDRAEGVEHASICGAKPARNGKKRGRFDEPAESDRQAIEVQRDGDGDEAESESEVRGSEVFQAAQMQRAGDDEEE